MRKVEFLFDFASPNCYVALAKLEELRKIARDRLEVSYSPIFLGGLFKLTNDAPVPVESHEFKYMDRNLRRISERLGIEFNFSSQRFPVNSLKALRGYYFADSFHRGKEYLKIVFHACCAEDRDISDLSVLQDKIRKLYLDPLEFAEFIERDETKSKLRDATQRAFERGVFGAPTFFVDGEMYWGSPEILWYLEKSFSITE